MKKLFVLATVVFMNVAAHASGAVDICILEDVSTNPAYFTLQQLRVSDVVITKHKISSDFSVHRNGVEDSYKNLKKQADKLVNAGVCKTIIDNLKEEK